MLLHSAEWLESAQYYENIHDLEVEPRTNAKLQVKYRISESISQDALKWAAE